MTTASTLRRPLGRVAMLGVVVALSACGDRPSTQAPAPGPVAATPVRSAPEADPAILALPADVRSVVAWAGPGRDAGGRPFAVLDKRSAHLHVFSGDGRLIASSWVLLGSARGDDSEPGIGNKPIAQIRPEERTTPAGRFPTIPGHNADGHPVVWVDYDAAVSMHVVVTNVPADHRLERLASNDPARHRISYGCINLPAAFFKDVAQPAFATRGGIVYVLPEQKSLTSVFPALSGRREQA